jgi:putative tryptophan/tyrosine transport system substrate-binding protein
MVGGIAATWPLPTRAQQPPMPIVGYLSTRSPDDSSNSLAAFRRGLAEAGYMEEQNVTIEYRWALGEYERLSKLAAELAGMPLAVLVTTGGELSAQSAKAATSATPIIFTIGTDPVEAGLVASYGRPGGNVTGITILSSPLEGKRVSLLHELLPHVNSMALLLNPNNPAANSQLIEAERAAQAADMAMHVFRANNDSDIEMAFRTIGQQQIRALAVAGAPLFDTRREKLIALSAQHSLPTVYHFREFALSGGLMSYGVDINDVYRQAGVYAGRILKGARPADLPVLQPTKFELVINLKTAQTFNLTVPPTLLARADEVIE